jgi:hypothetical protein
LLLVCDSREDGLAILCSAVEASKFPLSPLSRRLWSREFSSHDPENVHNEILHKQVLGSRITAVSI